MLKTVGGGINSLLGKNQQPTTPAMDPTGAADISSLEARVSALESGTGGTEGAMASNVGGMNEPLNPLTPMNPADIERQRLKNQTSNANQVGKLFAEEGGVVNTNNIARQVMAEKGAEIPKAPVKDKCAVEVPEEEVMGAQYKPNVTIIIA